MIALLDVANALMSDVQPKADGVEALLDLLERAVVVRQHALAHYIKAALPHDLHPTPHGRARLVIRSEHLSRCYRIVKRVKLQIIAASGRPS